MGLEFKFAEQSGPPAWTPSQALPKPPPPPVSGVASLQPEITLSLPALRVPPGLFALSLAP